MKTAGIIIIGNELLNGSNTERNASSIAAFFYRRGYRVDEIRRIRDSVPVIAAAVAHFAAIHEYVCTSGGIGPTHDDVTLEAVASAFYLTRGLHLPMERYLATHFPHMPVDIRSRLSILPDGTHIYPNNGHWPLISIRNCFTLPGVPRGTEASLRRMESIVLDHGPFITADLFANCSENVLCVLLEEMNDRFPVVEIGCYPATTAVNWKTKLHLESQDAAQLQSLSAELRDRLLRNNLLSSQESLS